MSSFEDQRLAFERDGYAVIDPGLSGDTLDGVVTDLEREFHEEHGRPPPLRLPRVRRALGRLRRQPPFRKYAHSDAGRIQDAWLASGNVRAIALAPAVLDLLQALYGRRPYAFQTLNFRVGTQQAPHSDALHFNSKPAGFMCGVWVALEDIDADNGPLVYYPGSHKLPEVTMQDVGVRAKQEEYPRYEDYIGDLIATENLAPHYALLHKGQALVWAANLLHGGAKQNDLGRTRLSQVTHYLFEDCDYWTPMLSDGDHIHWRKPRRIK
jgi:ectoine hydroxylase-related dioxygenase (phytanoyl-CoA dioxygenase family)